MKKLIALALVLVMALAMFGCTQQTVDNNDDQNNENLNNEIEENIDNNAENGDESADQSADEALTTYAEYIAAEDQTKVVVETYVQASQSWWDNKITLYTQNEEGAYFIYNAECSEADAAKLEPGTKIKVTGYKSTWSGEVEIVDATFEIIEGEAFNAFPVDVTELLGKEEIIEKQNQLVAFKGMTVEAVTYKNDEPGDDIYVTLSKDGVSYDFCVEMYLTGPDTDLYKAVQALNVGDVIDVEGFLYWYEGMNPHITAVAHAQAE